MPLRELRAELTADGGDIHADFLEHLPGDLPTHTAAAGLAGQVRALPRRVDERRIGTGFAFDLLEGGADSVAQRLEPVSRRLLLFVECKHRRLNREERSRMQAEA